MSCHQQPADTPANLTQRLNNDFALQAAGLGVWELDPVTKKVFLDDQCRQLFGLAKDNQLPYKQAIQYIHPDDQTRVDQAVQQAISGQSNGQYDVTYRTMGADDGLLRWVRFMGGAELTPAGQVHRFGGVAQEVTPQVLAHHRQVQETQEAQDALQGVLAIADTGTWTLDVSTGLISYSQRLKELFEFTDDTIGMDRVYNPILDADQLRVAQAVNRALDPASGGLLDEEYTIVTQRTGRHRIVRAQAKLYVNEQGQPHKLQGSMRDVTQERDTQLALEQQVQGRTQELEVSEARYRQLAQSLEAQVQQRTQALATVNEELAAINEELRVSYQQERLVRQQLEESEVRFRSLVEEAPIATCLFEGRELRIEVANQPMIDILGKGWSVFGKPLSAALPELTGQPFLDILDGVFTTGNAFEVKAARAEVDVEGVRGSYYFDSTYKPLRNANGSVYAIIGMAIDVTQQVQARQELEASEARYRQLWEQVDEQVQKRTHDLNKANQKLAATNQELSASYQNLTLAQQQLQASRAQLQAVIDNVPIAIGLYVGRDLVLQAYNQTLMEVAGKGPDIGGKPMREFMAEFEDQAYLELMDSIYTSQQPFRSVDSPVRIVRHGLSYNEFYNLNHIPLLDETGQTYAILGTAVNVTEQVKSRQAIEESEARYRLLSTQLEALVQERTQELMASEARYRRLAEQLEVQVQERTEQLAASNEELAATNEELTATNEDFLASNQALEGANHDLLRSNQNLEQFAYIASHDLQEPLRKIQQFGDLLKQQYGDHLGDGVAYLERMQIAATRMSVLIRDLLAFSRISTTQVIAQPVALNQVVNRVLDTLSVVVEESGAQVEVTRLPVVPGDHSQLDQLFQNLLSNAFKFRRTSPGGELVTPQIRVKASLVAESELPPSVHPSRYAQTYHCIEVADNGIGFEEKYLDRMFQVFQRLHGKNEYAGTGIGLAIVQKVVTNHGGAITATSEPGQGATFLMYLPA